MTKRQVFYSFDYDNDVMRASQVKNIGILESTQPVSPNEWEEVKKKGDQAIMRWIDNNMASRSCVIVLIGTNTSRSRWVRYEIEKAYNDKKGLFGVYIHNLKDPRNGVCYKGANPFEEVPVTRRQHITCYDPSSSWNDALAVIRNDIGQWVEKAIDDLKFRR